MPASTKTSIRAFDGSRADAEGLLAVEQAAFEDCPYDAEQVRVMLTGGPQRAWLALGGDRVAGFVVAFPTSGLRGPRWEIDLLAVHPRWRGRGLATKLIQVAAAHGTGAARQARAFVATDNGASLAAFSRAGFQAGPEAYKLLIYRPEGGLERGRNLPPAPGAVPRVTVRTAGSVAEAAEWLPELPALPDDPGPTLLLAERDGQTAGYAELIQVQTLHYDGLWIESLKAQTRPVREALICQAANQALAAGLDEIGAMAPDGDWILRDSLLAWGFRSLGDFYRVTVELSAPDPSPPSASLSDGA